MERIRLVAGWLLVVSGVVHVLQVFRGAFNVVVFITLLFGILYMLVGVLLLTDPRRVWYITGIVIPMLGIMAAVLGAVSAQALNWLLFFYIVMDLVVMVCCFYLIRYEK